MLGAVLYSAAGRRVVTAALDQQAVILLDIEGTTTPIDFVYQVLFPYARLHARQFIERHASLPEVRLDLDGLRQEHVEDLRRGLKPPALADGGAPQSLAAYIDWLIVQDRKLTPLKSLQGKIWEEGYLSGELQGRVFDDVPAALKRWHRQKRRIAIFSSGSVLAQRLLFAHTTVGDLTKYLSAYFDTTIGSKSKAGSYTNIARALDCAAGEIVFLSDVTPELDAAAAAGFAVLLCQRPGNHPQPENTYKVIPSFDEV
jgi:enolase-phosphatase E1